MQNGSTLLQNRKKESLYTGVAAQLPPPYISKFIRMKNLSRPHQLQQPLLEILAGLAVLIASFAIWTTFFKPVSAGQFQPELVDGTKINVQQEVFKPEGRKQTGDVELHPALKPALVISEQFYDFGVVFSGEVKKHVFFLNNRGNADLEIKKAYTTCGCTRGEISADKIPPGKSGLFSLQFDSGFHNMSATTVRRGVMIETNDPVHPNQEIWIQASVR